VHQNSHLQRKQEGKSIKGLRRLRFMRHNQNWRKPRIQECYPFPWTLPRRRPLFWGLWSLNLRSATLCDQQPSGPKHLFAPDIAAV
jgi:hypothetical protein